MLMMDANKTNQPAKKETLLAHRKYILIVQGISVTSKQENGIENRPSALESHSEIDSSNRKFSLFGNVYTFNYV